MSVILPPDVIQMMERFGRYEIDPMASHDDGYAMFQATQEPLIAAATTDGASFVEALAGACVPVGGWAVYGAERTVVNLIGTSPPGDGWSRLLDGSLGFLRANYVPPARIPPYAWQHFVDGGGTADTWIPLRPPPDPGTAHITPLREGEIRRLMRLGPAPDANVVLARRVGEQYVALIDARWSDEDPTRSQSEWRREDNLYDLYVGVAWSFQVWDWANPEIEPFLPAPKALI